MKLSEFEREFGIPPEAARDLPFPVLVRVGKQAETAWNTYQELLPLWGRMFGPDAQTVDLARLRAWPEFQKYSDLANRLDQEVTLLLDLIRLAAVVGCQMTLANLHEPLQAGVRTIKESLSFVA